MGKNRNSFCLSGGNSRWSTRVNFINIICTHFLYKIFGAKTSNLKHSFVIFGAKISYDKCVCKMLMKLTPCLFLTVFSLNLIWRKIRRYIVFGTLQGQFDRVDKVEQFRDKKMDSKTRGQSYKIISFIIFCS
jgi:hypothetical protein